MVLGLFCAFPTPHAENGDAMKYESIGEANLDIESRLQKAEFERDILAEALAWGAGRNARPWWQHLPFLDAEKKWLEYAYKEASRRVGYPVPRPKNKDAGHALP
jgi:hypothetical protein